MGRHDDRIDSFLRVTDDGQDSDEREMPSIQANSEQVTSCGRRDSKRRVTEGDTTTETMWRARQVRIGMATIEGDTFTVVSVPEYDRHLPVALTPSEQDIIVHILLGQSNRDIAHARGTRISTVSNQVYSIFEKIGVESRAQLADKMVAGFVSLEISR